jgi:predicted Zn-dependent peptidase
MTPRLTQLDCGARVVSLSMPHLQSFAMGIWTAVGARHEPVRLHGISHFLEHLLFKGTPRRSARRISQEVEGVGGDINAQTSEERTCYYASAGSAHFERVSEVLFDLYCSPRLAEKDIELERGVIAEEILMYRDEPDQHVHELLHQIFWPRQALGRPIAGTLDSIARLQRNDFVDYRRSHYHPGNTLISAAGAIEHERLVELAERHFSSLAKPSGGASLAPRRRSRKPPTIPSGVQVHWECRETNQTQVSLGLPGPDYYSPDRYAVALLHILLGGNSSSRLFQDLRERRGWCYSVATYQEMFTDTGMLNVCLGLDANNVEKCLRVLGKTMADFQQRPVRRAELRRAQEYVIGSSNMALERSSAQNNRLAQSLLVHGRVLEPHEWEEKIRATTPEEIQAAARRYLDLSQAKLALIGPQAQPRELEKILANGGL